MAITKWNLEEELTSARMNQMADEIDNGLDAHKADIVQTDEVNSSTKYPSSAVTYAHGQSIDSLIATQGTAKVKGGVLSANGGSDTVTLPGGGIYLLFTQREIGGEKASFDIISATGFIYSKTSVLTYSTTEITFSGLALTIKNNAPSGLVRYYVLKLK